MVKKSPRALPPAPPEPPVPVEPAPEAEPVTAGWPDVSNAPAGPHCPWCSAALASTDLTICPSCGAQLNPAHESDVPGVTTIDVKALAWKTGSAPRRNKILSWISGDIDDAPDPSGASASAVEPPSLAVRREMLRLELEAEGMSLPAELEGASDGPAPSETEPETPGT